MILSRNISSAFVLSVAIAANLFCCMIENTHAFEEATGGLASKTQLRREDGLDHWDSDTLAYYLDNYPGYDLAVMFYAPWDTNSQRLAPYWNQIAHAMGAGSIQSNLIMSLFDCELNTAHSKLCQAAGITHYPTMMFIGSGTFYDTDPVSKILFGKKAAAGMFGESPVPNTIKFQGNWMYPDSVKDWIKTMQALSRWHIWSTEGFGKKMRRFFLPSRKGNDIQLPIGVPGGSSIGSSSSNGAATVGASDGDAAMLAQDVEKWKGAAENMKKVATRSGTMMDSLLFAENSADMFTYLDQSKAWKDTTSYESLDDIYRACVMETSLDYCQRLAEPVGTQIVNEIVGANLSEEELQTASENVEALILDGIAKKEPYCAILDECIVNDMKDQRCRPKKCPFNNELACRMLNSCEETTTIKEYADALELDFETLVTQAKATK